MYTGRPVCSLHTVGGRHIAGWWVSLPYPREAYSPRYTQVSPKEWSSDTPRYTHILPKNGPQTRLVVPLFSKEWSSDTPRGASYSPKNGSQTRLVVPLRELYTQGGIPAHTPREVYPPIHPRYIPAVYTPRYIPAVYTPPGIPAVYTLPLSTWVLFPPVISRVVGYSRLISLGWWAIPALYSRVAIPALYSRVAIPAVPGPIP